MATTIPLDQALLCLQCDYDLRGLPATECCPECGLEIAATQQGYCVVENHLVVRSPAVLPERCIKTNLSADVTPRFCRLYWSHPIIYFLFPLSPLIALFEFATGRNTCEVIYYLSPAARRRLWCLRLLPVVAALFAVVIVILVAYARDVSRFAFLASLLGLLGLIAGSFFSAPFRIHKARGDRFWIKGCGAEFLDSIRRDMEG